MPRSVTLDPAKYGLGRPYVFKKWGAQRALGVLDWLATSYGPGAAETAAEAVRALLTGKIGAGEAGSTIGALLAAHGRAGVWDAFLTMAEADEVSGLYRQGDKGALAPVWPASEAAREKMAEQGLDPDTYYLEDPLEILRLVVAMLSESFRPFGAAWAYVGPIFGLTQAAAPTSAQDKPPGSPS